MSAVNNEFETQKLRGPKVRGHLVFARSKREGGIDLRQVRKQIPHVSWAKTRREKHESSRFMGKNNTFERP